jgi:hypothetical protein
MVVENKIKTPASTGVGDLKYFGCLYFTLKIKGGQVNVFRN